MGKTRWITRIKKMVLGVCIAVLLYALLGFLVLPRVACFSLNRLLEAYVRVPATVARVDFNPFTGELGVHELRIGEGDRSLLGFTRFYVDVQGDSLWTRALHLRAVELDNASLALQKATNGELNLLAALVLPAEQPDEPADEPAAASGTALFPVRIDQIEIKDAAASWKDVSLPQPLALQLSPVTVSLQGLSTLPGETGTLNVQLDAGNAGHVELAATLALAERHVSGKLQLANSGLLQFWPYLQAQLPVVLTKGQLSFSADFDVDAANAVQARLDNGHVALRSLSLSDRHEVQMLALEQLNVDALRFDLRKQQLRVGKVLVDGLAAPVVRETDGRLNWRRVLAEVPPANAPHSTAKASAAPAASAGKPWQVSLPDVQVRNTRIALQDQAVTPALTLDVNALQLTVKDYESSNAKPLTVALNTRLGELGELGASGQVNLKDISAHLQVTSKDLDLRLAQAYLTPYLRMELRSGLLTSQLQVDLASLDPLTFTVGGDVDIMQLHTLDTIKNQDLLKWQQLQLSGVHYQHGERLDIAAVTLQAPYARFVINENRSTNLSELVIPVQAAPAEATTSPATAPAKALAIKIAGIDISDGSANFADYSLTPSFATAIAQLNGRIGTLDNQQNAPAELAIKGKVDRYAPVSIDGSLTPFDPLQRLDIHARFKRVELTTLTPYSGKFAGYRIRKGRLNLDLHYQIQQGRLTAQNKVVLEELQLGEKVESPDAVDLPVRLAIALLKDPKGNIKVELPIEGDLNNPTFSVGPVIWKTLRNLIVRVVKSPFSFIGGLIKGDSSENLDSVAFAPGHSELTGDAIGKLKTLTAALQERPELRLEVEGASARHIDGEPMARQLLEGEFRTAYIRQLQQHGKKLPADETALQVPPNDKPALLAGIYAEQFEKQPPAEWAALAAAERHSRMQQAILDRLADSERRLRQLARERAAAIKAWLVEEGGLGDARIYLLNAQLRDDKEVESVQVDRVQADSVASTLYLDSE